MYILINQLINYLNQIKLRNLQQGEQIAQVVKGENKI